MSKPDFANSIDLTPYLKRWVAIAQGRVVGVGLTREQAYRAAKRNRPKDKPKLWFINAEGQLTPKDSQVN